MRTKSWVRVLCALAVLSLIAAACGDDEEEGGMTDAALQEAQAEAEAAQAEAADHEADSGE